jgi:hypothetical protein
MGIWEYGTLLLGRDGSVGVVEDPHGVRLCVEDHSGEVDLRVGVLRG